MSLKINNVRPKNIGSVLVALLLLLAGCGGEPTLHPVTGTVTLGGKSYERLIVYFRPVSGGVKAHNMGVGETDATGKLGLRSTAGNGLATGKYRVSFSCMTMENSGKTMGSDEKADDNRNVKVIERVPQLYSDEENSPVEFVIKRGENEFNFDIPTS